MRRWLALLSLLLLRPPAGVAQTADVADPYTTRAMVTGQDERNRPLAFRLCFEDVLVKLSGDAAVLDDPRVAQLGAQAQDDIASYTYRDRFEGKPKHDEQGTYDRPFFMTCRFDHDKIDAVLRGLGLKPWLGHRPRVVMVLGVRGRSSGGMLSSEGVFDPDMRQSLAAATQRFGLDIVLPSASVLDAEQVTPGTVADLASDRLATIASRSAAELALVGDLAWSDADLGWVATWRLTDHDTPSRWQIRGVNYDEAFRDAVRGTMSVLSGHGTPREAHEP